MVVFLLEINRFAGHTVRYLNSGGAALNWDLWEANQLLAVDQPEDLTVPLIFCSDLSCHSFTSINLNINKCLGFLLFLLLCTSLLFFLLLFLLLTQGGGVSVLLTDSL